MKGTLKKVPMSDKPIYEDLNKRLAESHLDLQASGLFFAFINNSQNVICLKDTGGRYIFVNRKFCELFDLTEEKVHGKTPFDLFPNPTAAQDVENDQQVIRSRKPATFNEQADLPRGSYQYVSMKFPIFDGSGSVVATGTIANDVTELLDTEEKLRQSEEKFRLAFITSPDAINLNRFEDGLYIDINEGFTSLTGYTREEAIGKTSLALNLWKNPADRQRLVDMLTETGYVQNMEAQFVLKNGQVKVGLMSARVLRINNENTLLTITRDITDRKLVEEALRESERRFRDLSEMLPEAVFETDHHLNITYGNQRALDLYGYCRQEIGSLNGLDLVIPEDRARAVANLAMRMNGKDPGSVEYQGLKKDGSTFPVRFNANIILNKGQFAGLRGMLIDLTESKKAELEKARIESRYRQAQKVEAIGRLAGGVAHDLNNILTPIIGYSELLRDGFSPNDQRRDYINQITRAGYGARDLVHQLLAFSRKQTLEYKPLNLNKVLTGFQKLLRRTIREDIEMTIALSPDIPTVDADIGQIEQIIMNLCVNAQDAMPGGGKLTLETSVAEPDDFTGRHVFLTVSDNGCGMDNDTCEHIFEPFFSTKGEKGTGLGLATVYGIVKQHGGNIWVTSTSGMGTVFKVSLPVSDKAPVEVPNIDIPLTDVKGAETILLVEDNEQVRQLADEILRRQGYSLIVAGNGVEALNRLASSNGPVDLLLTDVVMPDMNGKELFTRAADKHPGIKVLYMSGYSQDVIAHHGVLDEGVRFIQKPFTIHALATKVREALDVRKSACSNPEPH
jgi:two-component system, cell cycle sensor histidine kinase and response regulator CckA